MRKNAQQNASGPAAAPTHGSFSHPRAIAAAALLALLATSGTALISKGAGVTQNPRASIAAAHSLPPPPLVELLPEANRPRVTLVAVPPGETARPAGACEHEKIERYFGGSAEAYEKDAGERARCFAGQLTATVLEGRIANADASIAWIDRLRALLEKTRERIERKGTLDGIGIVAIPAGANVATVLESAEGVALACLRGQDGTERHEVPVASLAFAPDISFKQAVDLHKTLVKEVEKNNAAMKRTLDAARAEALKEGRKDDELELGFGEKKDMLLQLWDMRKKMKEHFLPVDFSALEEDQPLARQLRADKLVFGISIALDRDERGNPIEEKISFPIKLVLRPFGVRGPFFKATLTMQDARTPPWESYPPLPERYLREDLLSAIREHEKNLRAYREGYERRKAAAWERLRELRRDDFGCAASK